MKRNLFSFPRSQMVGKMLRAMSFVVAVFCGNDRYGGHSGEGSSSR